MGLLTLTLGLISAFALLFTNKAADANADVFKNFLLSAII
jgi:hypothetical protein